MVDDFIAGKAVPGCPWCEGAVGLVPVPAPIPGVVPEAGIEVVPGWCCWDCGGASILIALDSEGVLCCCWEMFDLGASGGRSMMISKSS